jgi:hypothetical protein
VYLFKTKDEVLNYFKAYKDEAENQLERKINDLGLIEVGKWGIFL